MQWHHAKAIVTGGASGLGRAVIKKISHAGGQVAILDLDQQKSQELYSEICSEPSSKLDDTVLAITTDVSSDDSVNKAILKAYRQFGEINLAVNCAGITSSQTMISSNINLSTQAFNHVMDINLSGTFRVCRAVAEQMKNNVINPHTHERGVIINTASIAAFEGQIGQLAYSASKGAIISMTLPMARELSKYAIRVMSIAPGLFDTPLMENLPDKVKVKMTEQIPFPPRLGEPDEFAMLVQHIFENPLLNGSIIRLDGGLRMSAQ